MCIGLDFACQENRSLERAVGKDLGFLDTIFNTNDAAKPQAPEP